MDDLRHQVRALQAVAGYGAPADGDEGAGGGDGDEGARPGRGASLEALLMDKARRLEHELTMARLQVAEAQGGPHVFFMRAEPFGNLAREEYQKDRRSLPWS